MSYLKGERVPGTQPTTPKRKCSRKNIWSFSSGEFRCLTFVNFVMNLPVRKILGNFMIGCVFKLLINLVIEKEVRWSWFFKEIRIYNGKILHVEGAFNDLSSWRETEVMASWNDSWLWQGTKWNDNTKQTAVKMSFILVQSQLPRQKHK
jgi:hypothetical protein